MENIVGIEALINRYGGGVPRYTSYPTAVQFKGNFQYSYRADPVKSRDVSLYLHIPFCRSLCSYCGCLTKVVHNNSPIQDYLVSLENEISLLGSATAYRLNTGHVHFGGGSPNVLNGKSLSEVIDLLDIHFNIQELAEIAIEVDPRQMTREKARDYVHAGVSRVSLGVQDFNEQTQKAINRVQPFSMIENTVSWFREAGIRSINFDLIYGLPFQTVATVADNVKKAVSLAPDRVAVFGYAHVPWMRPHQKILERFPMPNLLERYRQAEHMREVFLENGYRSVGMDHFARPDDSLAKALDSGTLKRNFQGYTTDGFDELMGLGISSISKHPDAYIQNTTSYKVYKEKLNQGILPVERGCQLSAEDKVRATIIEKLMCYFEVDVAKT